jgi:hypothetical protein
MPRARARCDRASGHRCRSIRVQAGQEHRALDLRARHLRGIRDGFQRRSIDRQRSVAVDRCDPRAHLRKRVDHAPHRASGQRLVADEGRHERLGRQDSRQHSHRRSRVAGVERCPRRAERPQPPSADCHTVALSLDRNAEAAQAVQRRLAIRAGRVVREHRSTAGQRGQDRVPMRDRLVAGHADATPQRAGGSDRRRRRH